jgi:thiosulfate dehydrogenase (quinone) large subunit
MDRVKSFSENLFRGKEFVLFWLLVRLYVGLTWFEAGLGKITKSSWVGEQSGSAVAGFVNGALQKTGGAHPDVQTWYAFFLQNIVLPNTAVFSYLVAFGELLVGIALILGIFTGLAATFGVVMNMSYLLAGTVSTNPILLILGICLMLSWRVGGFYGMDRFLLSRLRKQ